MRSNTSIIAVFRSYLNSCDLFYNTRKLLKSLFTSFIFIYFYYLYIRFLYLIGI